MVPNQWTMVAAIKVVMLSVDIQALNSSVVAELEGMASSGQITMCAWCKTSIVTLPARNAHTNAPKFLNKFMA